MAITNGAFKGLITPRSILQYSLTKGVTDFSQLKQFDYFKKGYPFLVVLSMPDFLRDLCEQDESIKLLVQNYIHILENDFRGIDNIDNIIGEAIGDISNGARTAQIINKTVKQSNTSFSMTYMERVGSLLTKVNELLLTGADDGDVHVKTYHGLIDAYKFGNLTTPSGADPGPHREVWTLLYFTTNDTMTGIERAILISNAQCTTADFTTLYDGQKGDIQYAELSMPWNGFLIYNNIVNLAAEKILYAMRNPKNLTGSRIIVNSSNYNYAALGSINLGTGVDINASWTGPTYTAGSSVGGQVNADRLTESTTKTGSAGIAVSGDGSYAATVASMDGKEHYINT